ncbi:hypothetical protein KI387_028888 [Taxus chinensis]|uniref:Tify domain-containing protein n=1 Tax=Taxus chinensis TaxID=29808 RepID=A0AA38FDG5_TAXCH|nr:hypothetical protein KI387_028888 [Taxus chinensis]
MATLDMAGEPQPFFHDFLGMTPNGDSAQQQSEIVDFRIRNGSRHASACAQPDMEGETSVKSSSMAINGCFENSVCSAPARLSGGPSLGFADPSCSSRDSERLSAGKSRDEILSHGNKSAFRRPETDSKSAGKKRDSSPSHSADLMEHRIQVDRTETTRSPKMSRFEAKEDRGPVLKQHNVDDFHLDRQLPKPAFSCPSLLQQSVSKPDVTVSKRWESPSLYGPSRLGKLGGYDEKISCTATADNAIVASPFARPAADEGSRTGLQGPGIANLVNNGPRTTACRSTGAPGLSGSRSKLWSHSTGSDPLLPPSRKIGPSASSQLTIFYGGHAHVFDDVSPEKADAIIGLAGSSGRSWSTTYSPQTRSSLQPSANAALAGPSTTQRTLRSLQES